MTLFDSIRETFNRAATLDTPPDFLVSAELERLTLAPDDPVSPVLGPDPAPDDTPSILEGATGETPGGTIVLDPITVNADGGGFNVLPLLLAGSAVLFFTTRK